MLEIPETEDQEIEGFFEDDITRSKDQQLYDCGPFKIDIKIWDRDPEAIRTLKEILKKETLTEVKELLDESSGLNIHRDGFRIYPYGEPGHDWLDLNARRVQNPSLRLSINQISGNVFITREKNPSLKDRSDRQGIMQSRRLETFKNRIIDAINIIERKRFLHRQRKIKEKKEKEKEIDIFEKFYLADLKNYVKNNDDIKKDEITALIKGYDENITRTLDIIKDQLMIYRKLSVMGAFADEAIHNVKPHIGSIRSNSRSILRFLNSIDQEISELEQKKEYLRLIIESNDEIKRHFENLEPLSGSKKSLEKSTFHIGQVCRDTFASILRFTRTKYKIKKKVEINLDIKGEDVKIFELKGNWNVIFQNLIDNSIYWCNLHTDKIEMKLEINKFEDYLVLSFNDNGPGIDPEFEELIFLPYFSTKRDGVGLGLSIVKEIVEDLNGTIKTNYNENGAEFVINIPDKLEV
ncbi:MAG: HAMP domain-containing histidine kinase [Candidatus Heimdallarchaeota archaeon]|nr:HAMP domain-containing histidine kinase [Candidatus Heimdallarchaeota archaeon]